MCDTGESSVMPYACFITTLRKHDRETKSHILIIWVTAAMEVAISCSSNPFMEKKRIKNESEGTKWCRNDCSKNSHTSVHHTNILREFLCDFALSLSSQGRSTWDNAAKTAQIIFARQRTLHAPSQSKHNSATIWLVEVWVGREYLGQRHNDWRNQVGIRDLR